MKDIKGLGDNVTVGTMIFLILYFKLFDFQHVILLEFCYHVKEKIHDICLFLWIFPVHKKGKSHFG